KRANGRIKKSALSILPTCTALVPVLLIRITRVNTIPSRSTIVSAARYPCMGLVSERAARVCNRVVDGQVSAPGRAATASAVDGRQVELAEPGGVGEDVDLDDLPAPDGEAHDRQRPAARKPRNKSGRCVREYRLR